MKKSTEEVNKSYISNPAFSPPTSYHVLRLKKKKFFSTITLRRKMKVEQIKFPRKLKSTYALNFHRTTHIILVKLLVGEVQSTHPPYFHFSRVLTDHYDTKKNKHPIHSIPPPKKKQQKH